MKSSALGIEPSRMQHGMLELLPIAFGRVLLCLELVRASHTLHVCYFQDVMNWKRIEWGSDS